MRSTRRSVAVLGTVASTVGLLVSVLPAAQASISQAELRAHRSASMAESDEAEAGEESGPDTIVRPYNSYTKTPQFTASGVVFDVELQVIDETMRRFADGKYHIVSRAPAAGRSITFTHVTTGPFGDRLEGELCTSVTDAEGIASCPETTIGGPTPQWYWREVEVVAHDRGADGIPGTRDDTLTRTKASFTYLP